MIIFASRNQAGTVKKRKMSVPLLSDEFTPLSDNMKYGFDNEKYVRIQSEHIKERIRQFGDKLYLENCLTTITQAGYFPASSLTASSRCFNSSATVPKS